MTSLRLDAPLAHLRELSGLSHRALGARAEPPVSDAAVVDAERRGPRIKLATLDAYARAAEYKLWVEARNGNPLEDDRLGRADGLDVSVDGARALVAALGLTMVLTVEPAA